MITVSITEAKKRFFELCELVEKGETVVVTVRRKPVIDIIAYRKRRPRDAKTD